MIKFIEKIFSRRKRIDFHENQEFDNLPDSIQQSLLSFQEMEKSFKNSQKYVQEGMDFEKANNLDEAIKNYEKAVELKFDGNRPYDRLAVIYRKLKRLEDEKRILEIAIDVFENHVSDKRGDKLPKLERFKTRFANVQKLITKRFKKT